MTPFSPQLLQVTESSSHKERYVPRTVSTLWFYCRKLGTLRISDCVLVIDSSKRPCDGLIVVGMVQGAFRGLRYKKFPAPHLEEIDRPERPFTLLDDFEDDAVFRVVTWILNDARSG